MNNNKQIRASVNLSKIMTSNTILPILLTETNKRTPDTLTDFMLLLSSLPKDSLFSKERLEAIAFNRFPRLFHMTTYNKKQIKPFDFFFENLQQNHFEETPVISKVDNNLFKANDIKSLLMTKTPHLSLYNVRVNDKMFEAYNGNMSRFAKDCSWLALEKLCLMTNNKTVFTFPMIKSIFGLTKYEVKKYLKNTHNSMDYVYRTVGPEEGKDLGLGWNLFGKKNYKLIRGFHINIRQKMETTLEINFTKGALWSIKDRLEKEQYRYSSLDFFTILANSDRHKVESTNWDFTEQHERLGFSCVSSVNSSRQLKKYLENVNLGSYQHSQNICGFLWDNFRKNYHGKEMNFKKALASLKRRYIYQYS
jgi:hypothetical protein